jgi:DNA-binding IclR family transcriptional regulator
MKVILKTFDILEFVINSKKRAVSPKMVSDELGINHSTCIRIMSVLRKQGYLRFISRREGYIPGAALYAHYNSMRWAYGRLAHVAEKPIQKLAKDLNAIVNIAVMQDGVKYILYHFCGNGGDIEIKTRYEDDHHGNATGMLLLAHEDKKIIKNYYTRFADKIKADWPNIATYDDFTKKLSEIRQAKRINYINARNSNMLIIGNFINISDNVTAAIGFGYYGNEHQLAIAKAHQTAQEIQNAYNMEEQLIF